MPTGYTLELIERNLDFPNFVLTCARAFGVCITMRDEPIDVQPPEQFKVGEYHLKEIQRATTLLEMMRSIKTKTAKKKYAKDKLDEELQFATKAYEEEKSKNIIERYESMLEKVQAWTPPSIDHQGLKKFMIQQLTDSIKWDKGRVELYLDDIKLIEKNKEDLLAYFQTCLDRAERDVQYHTEKHADEVRRTDFNNRWLKQLRDCLKKEPENANRS